MCEDRHLNNSVKNRAGQRLQQRIIVMTMQKQCFLTWQEEPGFADWGNKTSVAENGSAHFWNCPGKRFEQWLKDCGINIVLMKRIREDEYTRNRSVIISFRC